MLIALPMMTPIEVACSTHLLNDGTDNMHKTANQIYTIEETPIAVVPVRSEHPQQHSSNLPHMLVHQEETAI